MSRDDIVSMAREAGCAKFVHERKGVKVLDETNLLVSVAFVERFAALVAAHEREECAKVCEQAAPSEPNCVWSAAYKHVSDDIAAAIRSRGTT